MMDSDPQDLQVHLSEYLQILDHYQYHEEKMPCSDLSSLNKRDRDRNINIELELLDSIALCLATGESHDVVATTFDKRHAITILLSKNRAPSVTDREQASLFFNALSDPKNTRTSDIIAIIATYAGMNMNKRVKKVAESLGDVRSRIEALMDGYKAGPRESEFHSSDPILSFELDVRQSLEFVINVLSGNVTDFDINSGDRMNALKRFEAASQAAYYLTKTRFIRSEAGKPTCHPSFEVFQRRLAKLGQYSRGIKRLFRYRNRLSGQIPPFRWVDFPLHDPPPVEISESPVDVASRLMGLGPVNPEYKNFFWRHYPIPIERWIRTVTPTFHAEVHLILSLDSSKEESFEQVRPIGCSKRSCLCCWYWINSYNIAHHTKWMTDGSHGKPYMNWALSGDIPVDLKVVDAMRSRVLDTLEWMEGWKRRPSDEHASRPGSSSDSEDAIENGALWQRYARYGLGHSDTATPAHNV